MTERRRLGRTAIEVSPVGLGCWQFSQGAGTAGRFWESLAQEKIDPIVAASLAGGIDWFDTAEAYGNGRSERALAAALRRAGRRDGDVVVATKWTPLLRTARSVGATIGDRIASLAPFAIDLHQVHHPWSLSPVRAVMHAMADLVAGGRVRAVGVSNYGAAQTRAAHAALAARGVPLATNQVRYSLLDRRAESRGVVATAKALGVTLIAYSPLAQGLLTGKFHDDPSLIRGRPGPRRWLAPFRERGLATSRPVVEELRKIAAARGVTAAQVALRWLLDFHGDAVVVIPGATRAGHVEDNVGAQRFRLDARELARLDERSRPFL